MVIQFRRGDSYEKGFVLRKNKQPDPTEYDEIYLTVKKQSTDMRYLLQKRLTTGGIVNDGNGHYTVFFFPQDTDNFAFGSYEFDIEVRKENYCRTFCGDFIIDKEITYRSNE
jgi:hypothetical protein